MTALKAISAGRLLSRHRADAGARWVLLATAAIALLILVLITVFIFRDGFSAIMQVGLGKFLFGTEWVPAKGEYGILAFTLASLYLTLGTLILAGPLGIGCAIFLAEVAPHRVREIVRPAIDLLVGIPSVVFGLVGMTFLCPLIAKWGGGGSGHCLLAATIVVSIMILPTVVSISEDSIRSVPREHKEGALALGATHWQAIRRVILPAARPGIVSALILGMGRAIGEALAAYMVIGNAFAMVHSPLDPARTLTSHIVGEIPEIEAGSLHLGALFATGIVLLVIILVFNSISFVMRRRS
jgi:phosphate transport system permease protein